MAGWIGWPLGEFIARRGQAEPEALLTMAQRILGEESALALFQTAAREQGKEGGTARGKRDRSSFEAVLECDREDSEKTQRKDDHGDAPGGGWQGLAAPRRRRGVAR